MTRSRKEADRVEPGPPPVDGSPRPVRNVYVHAPFCARRCFYCDFAVSVARTGDPDAWLSALRAELDGVRPEGLFPLADTLDSLYVGGGTPSLLGPTAMAGLRALFDAHLDPATVEWTAEANPESFTAEVARAWSDAGLGRLSLGLQTFHEGALKWMGRLHGPDRPFEALATARSVGLENVSLDLIFGLPATLGRVWSDDLTRVIDTGAPHVSLYGLTVEEGTPLGRAVHEGRESPVDEEAYRAEFLEASERLTAAGYRQYEVSNFARPGFESRHNSAYWSGAPYLGLGNGAHSFQPPVRRWNVREWEEYREAVTEGRSAEGERERLTAEATALEAVWLGLRTADGLPLPPADSERDRLVGGWEGAGLVVRSDSRFSLTPEGWLLLDALAVEYDGALPG